MVPPFFLIEDGFSIHKAEEQFNSKKKVNRIR